MKIEETTLLNNCLFCEFCEPEAFNQSHRVILRSDNFYLFAGLGPIAEKYIIITPNNYTDKAITFYSLPGCLRNYLTNLCFCEIEKHGTIHYEN